MSNKKTTSNDTLQELADEWRKLNIDGEYLAAAEELEELIKNE